MQNQHSKLKQTNESTLPKLANSSSEPLGLNQAIENYNVSGKDNNQIGELKGQKAWLKEHIVDVKNLNLQLKTEMRMQASTQDMRGEAVEFNRQKSFSQMDGQIQPKVTISGLEKSVERINSKDNNVNSIANDILSPVKGTVLSGSPQLQKPQSLGLNTNNL